MVTVSPDSDQSQRKSRASAHVETPVPWLLLSGVQGAGFRFHGASRMAAKTYFDKLKDPRWQKRRLEILNLNSWSCQDCGETSKLCEDCHKLTTERMKVVRRLIGCLATHSLERLAGYAHGISMIDCPVASTPVTSFEHALGIGDAWQLTPDQVIDLYLSVGEPIDGFALQETVDASRGDSA